VRPATRRLMLARHGVLLERVTHIAYRWMMQSVSILMLVAVATARWSTSVRCDDRSVNDQSVSAGGGVTPGGYGAGGVAAWYVPDGVTGGYGAVV
jgi:hypothetical protein